MSRPRAHPASDRIPAVVVGGGLMGRWHARELELSGGRLVGICDSDLAAARRLGAAHRGSLAADDLGELLAVTAPRVVHVCTPAESHVTIVEKVLEAGAHALVEKPLAPDAETTKRLLDRARQTGLLVCPVHQYLFQPGLARAEAELRSRGPLLCADAVACSAGGARLGATQVDRVVAEILPHPLAVLQRLLPQGIESLPWSAAGRLGGELRATAETDAAVVSLHVSMNGRPTRSEMRLIAPGGTIHLDFFHGYGFVEHAATSRAHKIAHPFSLSARRAGSAATNLARRALRREPAYPGLRELIEAFYAAVREDTPCPIPPADALAVAQVKDRLVEHLLPPRATRAEARPPDAR